jgi:hypothetical protein
MKSLILADLKVLGHRLWTIPLGVFLFIFSFSFIPYLNQVQQFQNWIFAILIPGLLTFELLREEQKNKSDSMLMTMPVSKEKYVWAKYILISGFLLISMITGLISIQILDFFKDKKVMEWGVQSSGYAILHASEWIFIALMMTLPVYYFSRKLKLSLVLGFSVFFTVLYPFYYFQYRFFSIWDLSHNIYGYLLHVAVLIISVIIVHIISGVIFKRNKKLIGTSIWFAAVMFLFTISISFVTDSISDWNFYFRLKNRYSLVLPEISEEGLALYVNWLSMVEKRYIGLIIVSIVLSSILIIIHRKTKDRFYQNCILMLFLPVLITILNQYFSNIIHIDFIMNYINGSFSTTFQTFIRTKITMIPGLLIIMYFSARSSIYLLKNNRTLK